MIVEALCLDCGETFNPTGEEGIVCYIGPAVAGHDVKYGEVLFEHFHSIPDDQPQHDDVNGWGYLLGFLPHGGVASVDWHRGMELLRAVGKGSLPGWWPACEALVRESEEARVRAFNKAMREQYQR